jgi:hypothetical protein
LMTGYAENISLEEAHQRGFAGCLQKPLAPSDIAKCLHDILDMQMHVERASVPSFISA